MWKFVGEGRCREKVLCRKFLSELHKPSTDKYLHILPKNVTGYTNLINKF